MPKHSSSRSKRVSGFVFRSSQTSRSTARSTIQQGWSSPSCGVMAPLCFSSSGSGGANVGMLLLGLVLLHFRPAVLAALAQHPLLELQDAVDEPLGRGRTAGHVHVDGDDLVDPLHDVVGAVEAARA